MSAPTGFLDDAARPTGAGFREVDVATFARERGRTRLLDVREVDEFGGELGHLPGAELIPLATLPARCADWDPDAALALVCRTGRRSATAAELLVARGFRRVLNVTGGTVAHIAAGLPVER